MIIIHISGHKIFRFFENHWNRLWERANTVRTSSYRLRDVMWHSPSLAAAFGYDVKLPSTDFRRKSNKLGVDFGSLNNSFNWIELTAHQLARLVSWRLGFGCEYFHSWEQTVLCKAINTLNPKLWDGIVHHQPPTEQQWVATIIKTHFANKMRTINDRVNAFVSWSGKCGVKSRGALCPPLLMVAVLNSLMLTITGQ